jgi:hypothetical protein
MPKNENQHGVGAVVSPDVIAKYTVQELAFDAIKYFCPQEFEQIDLSIKAKFWDKELNAINVGSASMNRVADNLVQVTTKSGEKKWLLFHIEVQGYGYYKEDNTFEKRMFTSYYRILDKYEVPVASIAILTDSNRNYRPHHYHTTFGGTELSFKFQGYKVLDQELTELQKLDNPFAIIRNAK